MIMAMLPLIFNMIRRNQALRFLINSPNPVTVDADPYNHDSDDFENCGAMKSSLWEIETLRKHFHPDVSKLANRKWGNYSAQLCNIVETVVIIVFIVDYKKAVISNGF